MYKGKRILALIAARGGSKGLPGKNLKLMDGNPLVSYPIKAALGSEYIDNVTLTSDDSNIMMVAKALKCNVPFQRPAELASDTASSVDAILHAIEYYEKNGDVYDYLVLLEPTSPLTETNDIDLALKSLIDQSETADSIIGVSKVESNHPAFLAKINNKGLLSPYGREDFGTPIRRQEIEELYFFDGSLYISLISKLKETRTFVHNRTIPFIVPKWKSFEIDDLNDFFIVETLYKQYLKK